MTNFSSFSGKKILVTGASGFIGTHLCNKLYRNGAEVHGISRIERSEVKNYIKWWQGDVLDINIVRKIFQAVNPDIIFHLASYVVGARNIENVISTFHNNLTTTINILTVATELDCHRIIITGSLEEPDQGDSGATPSSPYAAAKWASSAYARMFHVLYKTPVAVARLFMVYGPGQRDVSKLIPYVTLSLLRNKIPELSSGQRQVDWIYVEDVVNGLLAMALASDIEGRTIELGSGFLVSVKSIVDKLVNIINPKIIPLFGHIAERPMEQVRVANVDKSYSMIAWKAETSIDEGLDYTVQWYRKQIDNTDRVGT